MVVIVRSEPADNFPMAPPNFENRTLFQCDNLPVLRAMNSDSVDLIAKDPPFNKGRDFHATPDSLAAGAKFQDRWSWEKDVHQEWLDDIKDNCPAVWEVIDAANAVRMRKTKKNLSRPREEVGSDMGAYLCFMAVRLMEMHRVLKPTGSIYLHCDPTASHYLKAVMDAIFGWENFVNEVIWAYNIGGRVSKRAYGRRHDTILFASKSPDYQFNWDEVLIPWDDKGVAKFKHEDGKGRYRLIGRFLKDSPIRGHRDVSPEWERTHPELVQRYYMKPGKAQTDFWNMDPINQVSKERQGYPTQKPLALYERIIKASSNPSDIVLDPFCGCATTLVAAERLKRQWIGIDIWEKTCDLVQDRLSKELLDTETGVKGEQKPMGYGDQVILRHVPPVRTDEGEVTSPYLRVKVRVKETDGPKWTRGQMYEHLLDQHGPKCQGCDRLFDDSRYLELDHNRPRSDGGSNQIHNRILLCGPCNRAKSNIYTLSGLRKINKKNGWMANGAK